MNAFIGRLMCCVVVFAAPVASVYGVLDPARPSTPSEESESHESPDHDELDHADGNIAIRLAVSFY